MRTTIDINDGLFIELKQVAARTRRSMKELIEDAIRKSLAAGRKDRGKPADTRLVTFKGRGVQRGVNLDSTSDLLEIMDGTE